MDNFDVDKLVRALSGAFLIWRFLPEDGSAATSIHRCFRAEAWREAKWRDRAGICIGLPFAPFVALGLTAFFTALNGRAIKGRTGKGILRQMREQIVLAARFAIPSPWYYIFELHDDEKRRHAGEFLNRWEMKSGLFRFLRDYNGGLPFPAQRSTPHLKDKARFAARCRQFKLATVPIVLALGGDRSIPATGGASILPDADLFVKPMHGRGGRHAERWEYQGAGTYRFNEGPVLTEGELLAHLQHASRQRTLLLQPRLVNHPEIADLADGVLSTVRVMSCRNEANDFEVTNAVLRMARSHDAVVDNFHAGGIAANVDMHSGELGPATGGAWGRTSSGWFEQHPETGAQIRGRKLPYWDELVALVVRTHRMAFSDQVVIGWDVAILADGPCLIEANKSPDLDIVQRVGDRPIGNERLGELLALNLRRAVAAKYALHRTIPAPARDAMTGVGT